MTRLLAAAALSIAAFAAVPAAAATTPLTCAAPAPRLARACEAPRCAAPRTICRAAVANQRTPQLEETALTVQERGRRELDALIASLN